jgi:hypothetical protein
MRPSNEYLGVVSDLREAPDGTVSMDVSRKRRGKIKALVRTALDAQECRSGLAASLFGKAGFMLAPCYSGIGRACLEPIMKREHEKSISRLTGDLRDSLEFIDYVCDHLPPLRLPLLPSSGEKVVIFTDAEGKQRDGPTRPSGHLGFTIIHPRYGKRYAHRRVPDSLVRLLDAIEERKTYIGQFELVAAITPFLSLPPEWLHGYPVELWIDNSGAIGGLVKGYSGVPDCARIINMFRFAVARVGPQSLYIDYVPSESNPADIPSRLHEMDAREASRLVADLGDLIEMVVPTFGDADGHWLSFSDVARSVWAS